MILNTLLYHLTPIKSLSYLERFFTTTVQLFTNRPPSIHQQILTIQFFLFIKFLHCLLLYFHPTSPLQTVALFDESSFYGAQREAILIILIPHTLLALYAYLELYLRPKATFVRFLNEILFIGRSKYFSGAIHGRDALETIQIFARSAINFTQGNVFVVDLAILYFETKMLQIVANHSHHFFHTPLGLFQLFTHLFFAFLTYFFFGALVQAVVLVNVLLTTTIRALFLKGQLNLALLKRIVVGRSNWIVISFTIRRFEQSQVELLQLVALLNGFGCHVLFAYLLVSIPMNAFMVGLLLQGHISRGNAFFIGAFVVAQFNGIFGIHLFAAMLCRVIHAPVKILLGLHVRIRRWNVPLKLRVDRLVAAWHTRQQYGMTYGKYGLISVKAFYKYLFLYGKFLMISYKLLR